MEKTMIEKDFVLRTLHILENYDGPYGVTLLINCMLGLLVLPKEKDYNNISDRDHIHFSDLGIAKEDIASWGNIAEGDRTAARFIRCLRNSVAHLQIESISEDGEIEGLRFCDHCGFEAVFPINKLKKFLIKLSQQMR